MAALTRTTIDLVDELGPVLGSRFVAAELRDRVERELALDHDVVIEFAGVEAVSPSFADELFAKLSPDNVAGGRLVFLHVAPSLQAIAEFVRFGRQRLDERVDA
jgi:hypothetical protein